MSLCISSSFSFSPRTETCISQSNSLHRGKWSYSAHWNQNRRILNHQHKQQAVDKNKPWVEWIKPRCAAAPHCFTSFTLWITVSYRFGSKCREMRSTRGAVFCIVTDNHKQYCRLVHTSPGIGFHHQIQSERSSGSMDGSRVSLGEAALWLDCLTHSYCTHPPDPLDP